MAASTKKAGGWTIEDLGKNDLAVGAFLDGELVSRFHDADAAKAFVGRQPAGSDGSSSSSE